jgi:GrpB-like predicted nucleotidyltransferase (UPF0157 family)
MNQRSGQAGLAKSVLGHVRLTEPDAEWAALFESERQRLAPVSGGAFRNIAHFGSTAADRNHWRRWHDT